MRRLLLAVAAGLLFGLGSPAHAAWHEATTNHFVIYSDGSEAGLRKTAVTLEKYDFLLRAMAKVSGANTPAAVPVKLKIYLMSDLGDVQHALPFGGRGILGFYDGIVRGPFAVALRDDRDELGISAQQVLFHEYAHHFMLQNFPATYPSWYVEGFAEFYGGTEIHDNDVIEVGNAALGRHTSFQQSRWLPVRTLLTAKSYEDVGEKLDLLYAQGWLLVHYLFNNKHRAGQLQKYLHEINRGESYEVAADRAFGTGAAELNRELRSYSERARLATLSLPFKQIDVGPIVVRKLRPAEDAMVTIDIRLSAGVPATRTRVFVAEVRKKAARYPGDPFALAMLVEAERLAGNRAEAMAAVEQWLAAAPNAPRALMHKGELQIEALQEARSTEGSAWESARRLLFEAHKRNPRDPLILVAYYDSFTAQGVLPPPGAQNGLVRAFELVPQDNDLRQQLAIDFEARGMIDDAITTIRPAALQLHADESEYRKKRRERLKKRYRLAGSVERETAREMLTRLEAKRLRASIDSTASR